MKNVTTELNEIVSRQNVITDAGLLKEYLRTGLSPSNLDGSELIAPIAAVRPVSTKHVSDILQFATKESVPVFIYGGGTSLAGGILGNEPGIIIDMRSMNNIISVSLEDRVARVQAGVLLPQLNSVLQAGNVFMAHDPQAFETTTIGGAVATNGTGYLTSKYGSMGDQVIGMEVVLPTGDILGSSQIAQTYSPGLNVGNIFIGTEGIYGVITEVLIRLFPEPQERRHYALEFESFQHGFLAIQRLFSEGIIPAMINFSEDEDGTDEGKIIADSLTKSVLHITLEGLAGVVDSQEAMVWDLISQLGAKDLGPTEAQQFWELRHRTGQVYRNENRYKVAADDFLKGRVSVNINTAVPSSRVLELRYQAINIFDIAGVRIHSCAVLGDPEMFSMLVSVDDQNSQDASKLEEAYLAVMSIAIEMGGTIEHSYGIGLRLQEPYEQQIGPENINLAKKMKKSIDPSGILNRGKVVPIN